jgi:hypothetical protein
MLLGCTGVAAAAAARGWWAAAETAASLQGCNDSTRITMRRHLSRIAYGRQPSSHGVHTGSDDGLHNNTATPCHHLYAAAAWLQHDTAVRQNSNTKIATASLLLPPDPAHHSNA